MLMFCLTGSSFAANCPTTGVNVQGENAGVSDKAYAYNNQPWLFGTSRSLGLWGSFVPTSTGTWYFQSEAYQCGPVSSEPRSNYLLDGAVSWGYATNNSANVVLTIDYRYRYTSYSYTDYFCAEIYLYFKIPNNETLNIISGSYTYTCVNTSCKDLSYSRDYACQPSPSPTRSHTPSPTASRSMTPAPTPAATHPTEFFTPGMQQGLYSIRRVFLAISYFLFALEA
jgi:hypothetical protein